MTNEADQFDELIEEAAEVAKAAKERSGRRRGPSRSNYTSTVREAMGQDPDIDRASLLRVVFRSIGFESSGVDAMTNDELEKVVSVGRRVMDLRAASLRAASLRATEGEANTND
jgi:hypothetical protein